MSTDTQKTDQHPLRCSAGRITTDSYLLRIHMIGVDLFNTYWGRENTSLGCGLSTDVYFFPSLAISIPLSWLSFWVISW
jgi:hypothetical protein